MSTLLHGCTEWHLESMQLGQLMTLVVHEASFSHNGMTVLVATGTSKHSPCCIKTPARATMILVVRGFRGWKLSQVQMGAIPCVWGLLGLDGFHQQGRGSTCPPNPVLMCPQRDSKAGPSTLAIMPPTRSSSAKTAKVVCKSACKTCLNSCNQGPGLE